MTRRESFQRIALLLGGAAIAPSALAAALAPPVESMFLSASGRLALLDELSETILPTTDTPGAKAAEVGKFIIHAAENCLQADRKKRFWEELDAAEASCKQQTGKSFLDCNESERVTFLTWLQDQKRPATEQDIPPFFTGLKMLVLHGYFTSEVGATQALNYDPVPGGWVADMKVDENTKAWTPIF